MNDCRGIRAQAAGLGTLLTLLAVLPPAAASQIADVADVIVISVPEPGTLVLLASGAAVLGGIGWLRRRK